MDEVGLDQVSDFKYLGYVLDESGTVDAEYHRNLACERKVAGSIKSLNVRDLQLEYVWQ